MSGDMDTDRIFYVGTHAAGEAVGLTQAQVARLIAGGWLPTRRGGTTPRGGRPPHLIARRDLEDAIARHKDWLNQSTPQERRKVAARQRKVKRRRRIR